jgi:hypothetical protein
MGGENGIGDCFLFYLLLLLLIRYIYIIYSGRAVQRLCFWFSLFLATVILWRLDVVLGLSCKPLS